MWNAVVTNVGATLLARMMEGGTLAIVGASAGTGTVPLVQLIRSTNVAGTSHTLGIIDYTEVENGIKFAVQITAENSAYTVNQVGIWATLDGGARTLLAIYQADAGEGIAVPATSEMPDFVFTFAALVEMDNTGTLTVNIDSSIFATVGMLNSAIADKPDIFQAAVTIPTTGWSEYQSGLYACTVAVTGILATDQGGVVGLVQTGTESTDKEIRKAAAQVTRITTAAGSITVYASRVPAVEIPVSITVFR